MLRSVLVLISALLLAPTAYAGDCEHADLQGAFTLSADCEGLADFNGIGQHQKRLFLRGTWGELTVIEVPQPYKSADPDVVMGNLGRYWTEFQSPEKPRPVTIAGVEGRTAMERGRRSSSRVWVLPWQGRNLLITASVFGKKAERESRLELITKAVEGGWKAR